jgi:hypothetical protein
MFPYEVSARKNYEFLFFYYAFIYAAIPNSSTWSLGLHQEATIGS